MSSAVSAWAVRSGETILPDTIHQSRRGAMVNYLRIHHNVKIFTFHTDGEIERWWTEKTSGWWPAATVVEVEIGLKA